MERTDELRLGRTEALFRDVNERIAESANRFGSADASFVCECSDPGCTHRIDAPLEAYEDVREDGARFLLAHGHERPDIERVIDPKAALRGRRKGAAARAQRRAADEPARELGVALSRAR